MLLIRKIEKREKKEEEKEERERENIQREGRDDTTMARERKQEIKKASENEIAKVTGISKKLAENIYAYLHND